MKTIQIIAVIFFTAFSAIANSKSCIVFHHIGNVNLGNVFFYWSGDQNDPVPDCPPTPAGFSRDLGDIFNGRTFRLITSPGVNGGGIFDGNTNAASPSFFTNDFNDFYLLSGGDLRFTNFDLELGGGPMSVINQGVWTLLTDNNINPHAGIPAAFVQDGGVFRKAGGAGISRINIPFVSILGGNTIDVVQGTLILSGEGCYFEETMITGNGTLRIETNAFFSTTTVSSTATLELADGTYSNGGLGECIDGNGKVVWSGGQFDGDFFSYATIALQPTGKTKLLASANFYNYGIFQGNGVVAATNAQFFNYGFVSPGNSNSAGGLTIIGNYAQQSSGTLRIGIAGRLTNQFDQLSVIGTFAKAGTLAVVLEGGFVPSLGDTFKIINATTSIGSFSSNYFSPLPSGLFWRTDRLSAFGELSVSSVPSSNAVWRSTYFTASELTNSNISGLIADPDSDGIRNVFEYLLGLNPRFADSNQNTAVFPSPVLAPNGTSNRLALRFAIPEPAPADAFYQIQVNDLAANSGWTTIASKTGLLNWTGAATVSLGNSTSGRVQVTVQDTQNAATSSKRFMRLQGTVLP